MRPDIVIPLAGMVEQRRMVGEIERGVEVQCPAVFRDVRLGVHHGRRPRVLELYR